MTNPLTTKPLTPLVTYPSLTAAATRATDLYAVIIGHCSAGQSVQFDKEGLEIGSGKLVDSLELVRVMARYEVDARSERTKAGIAKAQKAGKFRGSKPGANRKLDRDGVNYLCRLFAGGETKSNIAKELRISRETLYRELRRANVRYYSRIKKQLSGMNKLSGKV